MGGDNDYTTVAIVLGVCGLVLGIDGDEIWVQLAHGCVVNALRSVGCLIRMRTHRVLLEHNFHKYLV